MCASSGAPGGLLLNAAPAHARAQVSQVTFDRLPVAGPQPLSPLMRSVPLAQQACAPWSAPERPQAMHLKLPDFNPSLPQVRRIFIRSK